MQNAQTHNQASICCSLALLLLFSPCFHSAPHTKGGSRKKKQKKKSPFLLLSLGHGSNTITMVLPCPRGTVQHPIGAPSEHALHTKIMEKSLALFFYCYQSVVHLQSSTSLAPLSVPSLSVLFDSICPPLTPPLWISPCILHLAVWRLICEVEEEEEGQLYPLKLHPFCFASVLSMSPFSLLWEQSSLSMLKKWCNGCHGQSRGGEKGKQNNKNNSQIWVGSSSFSVSGVHEQRKHLHITWRAS